MSEKSSLDPTAAAVGHIMSIDDAGFDRILGALSEGVLVSEEAIEEAVALAVPELDSDQTAAIVGFSLAFGGASSRVADQEQFYRSVGERAAQRLEVEAEPVVERLLRLFSADCLVRASLAQTNLRDNAFMLQRSFISTDLRPVSLPDEKIPRLYSVVHRLRIDYTESGSSDNDRAVEIVVDHEDLESLISRAQAALDQQRSLQSTVAALGGKVWMPLVDEETS